MGFSELGVKMKYLNIFKSRRISLKTVYLPRPKRAQVCKKQPEEIRKMASLIPTPPKDVSCKPCYARKNAPTEFGSSPITAGLATLSYLK